MNFSLLIDILPFALASAVSPLIFTIAVLVASQKKSANLKSVLFTLGAASAISIIGFVIFFLLARVSPGTTYTLTDARIDLVLGIFLIGFALYQFFVAKPKKHRTKQVISDGAAFSIGFGFMVLNTSTIIMYIPAAHVASYYSNLIKIELLAVMVLFSLIPAIVPPILLALIHSPKRINSIKNAVNKNSRYIIAAIFGLIGIFELIKAIQYIAK